VEAGRRREDRGEGPVGVREAAQQREGCSRGAEGWGRRGWTGGGVGGVGGLGAAWVDRHERTVQIQLTDDSDLLEAERKKAGYP
jgi:hypothetical protein